MDSIHEEMAPKGQKRTRLRDSDDEEVKKTFLDDPHSSPESDLESADDLRDTTVPVTINPDAVLPTNVSIPASAIPAAVAEVAQEKLAPASETSSPEEFSSTPTIEEFTSSDVETE